MAISSQQFAAVEAYLSDCPITGDTKQAECFMLAKVAGSTNATILERASSAAAQVAALATKASNSDTHLILTAYWASL